MPSDPFGVPAGSLSTTVMFHVQGDVAAAASEVLADKSTDEIGACVAILADAALTAHLDSFIILLEDEVDHARDRIGAVNGRVAARHHVNAVDKVSRNRVHIDGDAAAQHVAANVTAAVDEHECARRAEAPQIEEVEARGPEEPRRVRLREGAAD